MLKTSYDYDLTLVMKPSTEPLSCVASLDMDFDSCRISSELLPVSMAASLTPFMLFDTSCMPLDASCTLREISLVAEVCSSTAEAIEVVISLI